MQQPVRALHIGQLYHINTYQELKTKKANAIPYQQYIKYKEPIQSSIIDRMKSKMNETSSQWNLIKPIKFENKLQVRDSFNQSLKRPNSCTQDRFTKESSSSTKSTDLLNGSLHHFNLKAHNLSEKSCTKINMTSRLNSAFKGSTNKIEQKKVSTPAAAMTLSRIKANGHIEVSLSMNKTSQSWFKQSKFQTFDGAPQFQIGKQLGRGQFSDVFMCIEKTSRTVFAIKRIKKEQLQDAQLQKQLAMEIKVQSQLSHPNIIKLFAVYQDNVNVYLLLEFCKDGELFKCMKKQPNHRFPEIIAQEYIYQLLLCIEYMHSNNYIHRDLKTENIMLSFDQIKLGDLGCVCKKERRNTFCGTIEFMAPEVINLKGYDQQVDAWQIAVLAFELVYGKTPFIQFGCQAQETIMENILKVNLSYKQNKITIPKIFSRELSSFISAGLQKDPKIRLSIQGMLKHPWILNRKQDKSLVL